MQPYQHWIRKRGTEPDLQTLPEQEAELQSEKKETLFPPFQKCFVLLFIQYCRLIINYSSLHFPHTGKKNLVYFCKCLK